VDGAKPKDLLGIPWLLAFALRADGWFLRSEIIWHKPNPMPESVRDRPTKAHETVFLLTKRAQYFYDADAIREEYAEASISRAKYAVNAMTGGASQQGEHGAKISQGGAKTEFPQPNPSGANARSVWTIATQPYSGAHFATMPPDLAERCIRAGTSERGQCPHCGAPWARQVERETRPNWQGGEDQKHDGTHYRPNIGGGVGNDRRASLDKGWAPSCECPAHAPVPQTVLDPFGGAGTTGLVADRLQRHALLIELNPTYASLARDRIRGDAPLLAASSA